MPQDCYLKRLRNEPVFTLLGRDYTGPATIDFWVYGQRWLRNRIAQGVHPEVAAKDLRGLVHRLFEHEAVPPLDAADPLIPKLTDAFEVADTMADWPTKKLAD